MSEQDGIEATTKRRRSRKTQKHSALPPALSRPTNDDKEAWKVYWKAQGQPWRTEPEIDNERQKYLTERHRITPDIEQGIYPFKGIRLSRADVEWLLATRAVLGTVDWKDVLLREHEGMDLRGANLDHVDLSYLPLALLRGGLNYREWENATEEQRNGAAVRLEGADLKDASLKGASLRGAHLEGAHLRWGQLEGADLMCACLEGAHLRFALLEKAHLRDAHLERADLRGALFGGAYLDGMMICDVNHVGPLLADTQWSDVNLSVVKWSEIKMLGDEYEARKQDKGKGKTARLKGYEQAVRANRQLALALQAQGLNEDATRFAYRAQLLQRKVLWFQISGRQVKFRQRVQSLGGWLFSWFLAVVAGYGYKPQRCFVIYLLALIGFTLAHLIVGAAAGSPLTFLNALAMSIQSLHGRLFSFQSSNPQTLLNTLEAFVGLFIEAIVVAVITQRILGR